jgi:hypothetical protein
MLGKVNTSASFRVDVKTASVLTREQQMLYIPYPKTKQLFKDVLSSRSHYEVYCTHISIFSIRRYFDLVNCGVKQKFSI